MPGMSERVGLRVIVPMKPVASWKRRLAKEVPDITREALVLLMLDHIVRTVTEALGTGACWVIGGDGYIKRLTEEAGGTWLEDPAADLNQAVLYGMRRAYDHGAKAALFLPADLPMATPADIEVVIAASQDLTQPVGVEALSDGGTNALLVPAALDLRPALGHFSYSRHRLAAEGADSKLVPAPAAGLVFDLDSPGDLIYAKANIPGFVDKLARWEERVGRDGHLIHPPSQWQDA